MNRVTLFWMAGACATMLPLCTLGLAMNQARTARRAVTRRIAGITVAHRAPTVQRGTSSLMQGAAKLLPIIRVETLFGFDRMRRHQYPASVQRVLAVTAVLAAAEAFIDMRMLGLAGLLLGPVVWVCLARLFYRHCNRRRTQTLFRQFPDALAMIVRTVRVGVPLSRAVSLVSEECPDPTAAEFRQLSEEVAIGLPLAEALRAMGARNELTEYRFFATALALQSQTGGGLAETLETLADTIRTRVAARLRGHALASEARASCYVLGALPFFIGAMLYLVNPGYMSILFTTSAGLKLLGVAMASFSIGFYLMQQITNRSLG